MAAYGDKFLAMIGSITFFQLIHVVVGLRLIRKLLSGMSRRLDPAKRPPVSSGTITCMLCIAQRLCGESLA